MTRVRIVSPVHKSPHKKQRLHNGKIKKISWHEPAGVLHHKVPYRGPSGTVGHGSMYSVNRAKAMAKRYRPYLHRIKFNKDFRSHLKPHYNGHKKYGKRYQNGALSQGWFKKHFTRN